MCPPTEDLRGLPPLLQEVGNRLYELAEEAFAAGLTEAQIVQFVRDGVSSAEADLLPMPEDV